jgi:CubicO group peptidase (beta-lactamase class C family)
LYIARTWGEVSFLSKLNDQCARQEYFTEAETRQIDNAAKYADMKLWTILIAFLVSSSLGQEARPDATRMDQVALSFANAKQFMGSVLVARGDELLFDKSYGMANLEWSVPNTSTTKFRIGSLTKQFTAAAILLLEERGKLRTEDPVKKYLADAPTAWDRLTLFNVLTHTGGIPDFASFPDYAQKSLAPMSAEQLVAWFKEKPLEFEPGAKFSYSNSDYILLGYLIERLSGYNSNSAIIERRAAGYSPGPAGLVNAGYVNMTVPYGAGALYSTTHDLLKWEQGESY